MCRDHPKLARVVENRESLTALLIKYGPLSSLPHGRPDRLQLDIDQGRSSRTVTPPGFEAEMRELHRLLEREQQDPETYHRRTVLIEGMLQRLRPGQFPAFRRGSLGQPGPRLYACCRRGTVRPTCRRPSPASSRPSASAPPRSAHSTTLQPRTTWALAYTLLPEGDRAANLQKAIACFEQALRFRTPEADPLDYATTQICLGLAYRELPVGDRAANLQQAIACFEQALHFHTPRPPPSTMP